MAITKQFLKTKPICKVTFRVPQSVSRTAHSVYVVGDFNNWITDNLPMKRQKSGDFTLTLDLDIGKEYQFRYLLDQQYWINDEEADKYYRTHFGDCENSVVVLS